MPRLLRQPGPAALAVGLAITGTYFLCHGEVQSALYQVAGVLAAVTIAVATLVRRPTRSRHWWLLAGGLALATAGDAVYWAISVIVDGDPAFPGPADAVYLTSSFLFVVAVAL